MRINVETINYECMFLFFIYVISVCIYFILKFFKNINLIDRIQLCFRC